jgi:hypothetical protein
LSFASSKEESLQVRHRLDKLLGRLGLFRHPTKGLWEQTKFGHHLGVSIDSTTWYFFAPADKLLKISKQARHLIGRATRNSRLRYQYETYNPLRDMLNT